MRPRTSGSSAFRPISWSVSTSAMTSPAVSAEPRKRGHTGCSDRQGFHEAGARRQAGDPVQDSGRHQAGPGRFQERHARRSRARPAASSSKPSSRAPRRRTITPISGSPMPTAGRCSRRRTPIAACSVPVPAGSTRRKRRRHARAPIALCAARRYIPRACSAACAADQRTPCAPKSNALSKRSSSRSGC